MVMRSTKEQEVVDFDRFGTLLDERKNKIEEGILKLIYDEDYFLKDKPLWLKDLFKKFDSFCVSGIQAGVKNTFLNTYVRYSFNNLMFCKIKSKLENIKIYLKLVYSEIKDPPKWVRDYSPVARQTWVEITIRKEDLIDETILFDMGCGLIKKSFNRVMKHPGLAKTSVGKPVKAFPSFVNPTKFKLEVNINSDGFVDLGIRVHKSQVPKIIENLLGLD